MLVADEYVLSLIRFAEDGTIHDCELALPRFNDSAAPIFTMVSHPLNNTPEPGRAFVTDPDQDIVVINTIRTVPHGGQGKYCSIILAIRVAGLLAEARKNSSLMTSEAYDELEDDQVQISNGYSTPWSELGSINAVPWHVWGPQNARYLKMDETWECPSTFGRRCVLSSSRKDKTEIILLDFGMDTKEISIASQTYELSSAWTVEVLPAPVSVDMSLWFEGGQMADTTMPCRVRTRVIPKLPPGKRLEASLWEDGIIVKVSTHMA